MRVLWMRVFFVPGGRRVIDSPAFRYHGGKFRLAPWVMQFFPEHSTYVEPFGGAAGVLLRKPRSYAEVYNDLDGDVVNFFRVVRDPEERALLLDALRTTPYAREEFEAAWEPTGDPVERARRLAIRAQMGFGSAGATKQTTGFRIDTARAYATAMHLWGRYPEVVAEVGERFSGVLVENRPAIDVMRQHDRPDTLHFVDPPYVHATRVMQGAGRGYYRHEMTDEDHEALLTALYGLSGYVVLSGYRHPMYDQWLSNWASYETAARVSAHRGTGLRTEVVWINPACAEALSRGQIGLFDEQSEEALQ